MLSTVFWDNRDNSGSLFQFTALTDRGFAGFADFLAGFRWLPVDKATVVRSFAISKIILKWGNAWRWRNQGKAA
ncbi:hypothetical protein [Dickeya undicola]|uniref:hypothetical protein n=1 Tax=Dickeya undicola TaxID=1577887 RepID=UPI0013751745|nr:hypothetical protein [Dickeya undicola]